MAACAALATGLFIAAHHPLSPWLAVAAFALWSVAAMRAGLWLLVLPACLPAMSLAPWSGWIVFEEFDLVALGAMTGGFARLAADARLDAVRRPALSLRWAAVAVLCAASGGLAFLRGLAAAGPWAFDWYHGHADPLNAWRVFKSLLYVLLLIPLLRSELHRNAHGAMRHIARGMVAGMCVVIVAVLWERAAYPGLLDFSASYRTVALFWDMHVGGAAIDGYLAMATPFVAWAVASARKPWRWAGAAVLALLAEYACLTSFSRGVYLAATGSLVVLGALLAQRPIDIIPGWQRRANFALMAIMMVEVLAIVGSDSFMVARLKQSTDDFGSRLAHWRKAVALLDGAEAWFLGQGLGRFPAEYAASVPEHEFSGSARVVPGSQGGHLSIVAAQRNRALAGLLALTQRVAVDAGALHEVSFRVRVAQPTRLRFSVCEMHLIHEGRCQRGLVHVTPNDDSWQPGSVALQGPPLATGGWLPRMVVFGVTLTDAGTRADLDDIVLRAAGGVNLLRNAGFSNGLAHWFPAAQRYFVPWHVDNLYLELLVEQGMAGLAVFTLAMVLALASLRAPRTRGLPQAPYLVASLVGALLVGLVSSLLDVPRVAFLVYFLAFVSMLLGEAHVARAPR